MTWSVQEATGGTVSASGLYTAPATAGTYHVIATSQADTTQSATAAVTVNPAVSVTVAAASATIYGTDTDQFTATVGGGPSNTAVTWSVTGGSTNGTITAAGVYTAPSTAGKYTVVATSVADPTKSASGTVTVNPTVSVTVAAASSTIYGTDTDQFTATVGGGPANTAVTWTVTGGSANGTITAAGVYTAPSTAGKYTVVATSVADPTKSASGTVTVNAAVGITVTAASPTVADDLTDQFTATVTGNTNTAVTWSVTGSPANGTISASGLYTPPTAPGGPFTVVATSVADPTKSASATVTVTAAVVVVTVTATSPTLYADLTDQFTAKVVGSTNTAVTWSVTGGSANGTVTAGGLYTAPGAAGTFTVVATSAADTTKSGSAQVTVTIPNPTITSTPTTTLAQATATYTYAIAATDPAGTAITYSLTPAVTGASITGSTLSWTPTGTPPLTGREMPTSFTVTAKTALGGTATQTWTVTPLREVTLTVLDKFWSPSYGATGYTTAAIPTPIPAPVGAILPGSTALITAVLGTDGSSNPQYTISNVPAGYYWLAVGPTEKYYTNTSTFDVGTDYVGQQLTGNDTAMTLTIGAVGPPVTGLDILSWVSEDAIWIGSANGNSWYAPTTQPTAAGTYTDTEPIPYTAPDITLPALTSDDDSYILQYVRYYGSPSGSANYDGASLLAYQVEASSFVSTATTYAPEISGTLTQPTTTETLGLTTSGWSELATAVGGSAPSFGATFFGTYLWAQPYTTPPLAAIGGGMPSCIIGNGDVPCGGTGAYESINGWPASTGPEPATITNTPHNDRQTGAPGPLYVAWAERCNGVTNPLGTADACDGAADGDSVNLSFTTPFTTAPPFVLWSQQETSVAINGYTTYFVTYSNSAVEFANSGFPPTTVQTVQPVVGAVGSPAINVTNWATAATLSAPLTLSWTAPTTTGGATIAGYDVIVYPVPTSSSGSWGAVVTKLYTDGTSLTVPTGLLPAGSYVFVIEARADARANVATTPFRSSYPTGTSQVVSQAMKISGS